MPDQETVLVAVQHPGEISLSLNELRSHWPKGTGVLGGARQAANCALFAPRWP